MARELTMRSRQAIVWCVVATVALTALDLGTKAWALNELSEPSPYNHLAACEEDESGRVPMQRVRKPSIVLVEDYFELRYAENCAAAFSLLHSAPLMFRRILFSAAAVAAVIMLMWMFVRGHGGRAFAISVPLIISGALGNLIDRLRLGYVVDFLRFHVYDSFEWPTFNVADATITVGVVLLLIDNLQMPQRKAASNSASAQTNEAKA